MRRFFQTFPAAAAFHGQEGDMNDLDDGQLAARAAAGEARAFEQLVQRHADLVFRVAWKWCGNRAEAEDITQEVFLKVADKIHAYEPRAKFTTWLYKITVNEARDHLRSERRRVKYETDFARERGDTAPAPEQGTDEETSRKRVQQMLHKLPEKQREAVLLVICGGLSHRDAAQALGCAEKTVTWRIFAAKKKLTELYGHG
jgi:RNA polymerase sigma-70 factor (ECF subfamily)